MLTAQFVGSCNLINRPWKIVFKHLNIAVFQLKFGLWFDFFFTHFNITYPNTLISKLLYTEPYSKMAMLFHYFHYVSLPWVIALLLADPNLTQHIKYVLYVRYPM